MITIYKSADARQFTKAATIADGEIVQGEDNIPPLTDDELADEEKLLRQFDGPYILAVKHRDDNRSMQLAAEGEWVRYRGPQGGEGWQHPVTGEVRYQKDKPDAGEGADAPSFDPDDWDDYESGNEQFMDVGDYVVFEENGDVLGGTIKRWGPQRNLLTIEGSDGEDHTIEVYDLVAHQPSTDDLSATRDVLREAAKNAGIDHNSTALSDYTDDTQYRRFQDALRSAEEIAKESPVYEDAPRMETASAALLSVDERTANTIKNIQGHARADLPKEITVYRGIEVDDDSFIDRAESAMENGNPISDTGFQSATINKKVADSFGNVTLEITTDHGAYVRAASEHAGEDEVLLPAGQEFAVESVDTNAGVVKVTAVGQGLPMDMDLSYLRSLIEEEGLSYGEAVSNVV